MFEELRYRWELKKYLEQYKATSKAFEEMPEDDLENVADEPRYKMTMGRELQWQEFAIARFRSKWLVEQAYRYHVPIPEDKDSWEQGARTDETVLLTAHALGLISEAERVECTNIRKVRNEFAHAVKMSFDDDRVRSLCANLKFIVDGTSPRGQFTSSAVAVIANLYNRPFYVAQARLKHVAWKR